MTESEIRFVYNNEIEQYSEDEVAQLYKKALELIEFTKTLPPQRSPGWFELRKNVISASDWGSVLKMNKYASRNSVIKDKVIESKRFSAAATLHGTKYEPCANMIYMERNNAIVYDLGLIPHREHKHLAASPDGLVIIKDKERVIDVCLVEIKCPPSRELTGKACPQYWAQMQGQMEICNIDKCFYLECKFEEYSVDEEYYNDNHNGDYMKNGLGMEKGIVIVFMNRFTNDYVYRYSKLGIRREEYQEWYQVMRKEVMKDYKMIYLETTYWKLIQVNCIPIKRDKEWFEKTALPELTACWKEIMHYRTNGAEELIKKMTRKKKSVGIPTYITDYMDIEPPKCLFSETDLRDVKHTTSLFSDDDYVSPVLSKKTIPNSSKSMFSDHLEDVQPSARKPLISASKSMFSDHVEDVPNKVSNPIQPSAKKPLISASKSMFNDHLEEVSTQIQSSAKKPLISASKSMFSDHVENNQNKVSNTVQTLPKNTAISASKSMFSDHVEDIQNKVSNTIQTSPKKPLISMYKKVMNPVVEDSSNKVSNTIQPSVKKTSISAPKSMFSDHVEEVQKEVPIPVQPSVKKPLISVDKKVMNPVVEDVQKEVDDEIIHINEPLFSEYLEIRRDSPVEEIGIMSIETPLFAEYINMVDEPSCEEVITIQKPLFSQ